MANPFTPVYATTTADFVDRLNVPLVDLNFCSGNLVRDPTGDPAWVSGVLILVSRLTRALLTAKGDFIWDPQYGSEAIPGLSLVNNVSAQVSSAALREIRRIAADSRASQVLANVSGIRVVAVNLQSDPRIVDVDIWVSLRGSPGIGATLHLPLD